MPLYTIVRDESDAMYVAPIAEPAGATAAISETSAWTERRVW